MLLETMKPRFKDERLYEHIKYNCLELSTVPGKIIELLSALKDGPPFMGATKKKN